MPKVLKVLTFKVERNEELVAPRWREIEVENKACPRCGGDLVVSFTPDQVLYGYCTGCKQYFIGE